MARRKNSAEMLDILRRITNERNKAPKSSVNPVAGRLAEAPPKPPAGDAVSPLAAARRGLMSILSGGAHREERSSGVGRRWTGAEAPASAVRSAMAPEVSVEAMGARAGSALGSASRGPDAPGLRDRGIFGRGTDRGEGLGMSFEMPAGIGLGEPLSEAPAGSLGSRRIPLEAPKGTAADAHPPVGVRSESSGTDAGKALALGGPSEAIKDPGTRGAAGPGASGVLGKAYGSQPMKPLLGGSGDREESILRRAVRVLVGEEIAGGLGKRVEVRLVTISLYIAVALGAMLIMAFLMNGIPTEDRTREIAGTEETNRSAEIMEKLEIVPPGSGMPPALRNVDGTPSPSTPDGGSPEDAAADTFRIQKGDGRVADNGCYVQIQAKSSDEEAQTIIEHLKTLGYKGVWLKPNGEKALDIRIGPYASRVEAAKEVLRFKSLIKKNPPKKLRRDWSDAFPIENHLNPRS